MRITFILLALFYSLNLISQGSVEAEFDTIYKYDFKPIKENHNKKVLVDAGHNTIYSLSYGRQSAREMLRILEADKFQLNFTDKKLNADVLNSESSDLLIIHGIPNDRTVLKDNGIKEVLYTSPLTNSEVTNIAKYVYNGGGLLMFLSHFPGGSGGLPLLEAFSVKFRDGYAFNKDYHISEGGNCGHFLMNEKNGMLNSKHPVFNNTIRRKDIPKNVKFYCGAAVFRNPEDVILPFPKETINYTPATTSKKELEETSNYYAGMIGFTYGKGKVIICTDQGIFRSLDLLIDDKKIPVTIHDPESENAALFLASIRWLTNLKK